MDFSSLSGLVHRLTFLTPCQQAYMPCHRSISGIVFVISYYTFQIVLLNFDAVLLLKIIKA